MAPQSAPQTRSWQIGISPGETIFTKDWRVRHRVKSLTGTDMKRCLRNEGRLDLNSIWSIAQLHTASSKFRDKVAALLSTKRNSDMSLSLNAGSTSFCTTSQSRGCCRVARLARYCLTAVTSRERVANEASSASFRA